jgi:dTMP kinase
VSRKREPNSVAVLLRIPVFRRLWAAIAISSLCDWLGLLATTALAAYLTKDSSNLAQGAAVSGVLLTRLLPDLILGPIAGALVDRFDRRKVAVVGDTLAGLLYVSIIFSGNLLWLLVAQFLVEAIGLFSTPAKQAMWVNIVPRERLAVANQLNYVSVYGMVPVAATLFVLLSTLASLFGVPSVAGDSTALISGTTSTLAIDIALGIDAATYFFSAGMVFLSRRMIPPFVGDRSTGKNIFSLIAEGVSFVRKNRLMRSIYVGILGAFFAGGLVAGVAQSYVATLGAGNAGYGILFGSVFTGLALGMLVGPKVFSTVPRRMIFTPAIGAAGISLIVMSVLQDFVGAVVAATVMGVFAGIAWINGFTMIGHEVTDQLRGRVFAFVMSSVRIVLLLTIAAGPILAGAIGSYPVTVGDFRFEITGPAIVLAVGGLIAFGVSLFTGQQIGGLTSGLARRVFGRRGVNIWDEQDNHAGVLIAVEGADRAAVTEYANRVDEHLRAGGWLIVRVRNDDEAGPLPGRDNPADALRAAADLADLTTTLLRPPLEDGAVVVCEGFVDATVAGYRVAGVEEQRLARVAQWAVNGLKPDLTVLVDGAMEADPPPTGESLESAGDADEDDDRVDAVQAYRDRASYTPERYLIVRPLSEEDGVINNEVVERISSVLRQRSPSLAEPIPASVTPTEPEAGPAQDTLPPDGAPSADGASSVDHPTRIAAEQTAAESATEPQPAR